MKKNEFEAEMARNGDNGRILAKAMKLSKPSFSNKKNGKNGAEWNTRELTFFKKRWNLSPERFDTIFF